MVPAREVLPLMKERLQMYACYVDTLPTANNKQSKFGKFLIICITTHGVWQVLLAQSVEYYNCFSFPISMLSVYIFLNFSLHVSVRGQEVRCPSTIFVPLITQKVLNGLTDFDEIFKKGQKWSNEDLISFWEKSESAYLCH